MRVCRRTSTAAAAAAAEAAVVIGAFEVVLVLVMIMFHSLPDTAAAAVAASALEGTAIHSTAATAEWKAARTITTAAAAEEEEEEAAGPYRWGFRGAGYHMQLEVEFPLLFDDVQISLDLPRAFFFDTAEVEQQYSLRVLNDTFDIAQHYTPLKLTSKYFFDIEAPAFHVPYDTNSVNISFARLPLSSLFGSTNQVADASAPSTMAAAALALAGRKGRALLLLPIHARYEEIDTTRPFSFGEFFSGDSFVQRCIPAIVVRGGAVNTTTATTNAAHSYIEAYPVAMERYEEGAAAADDGAILPQNCQRIPVGMLSSLPFVYVGLVTLQCAGAAFVVFSLLRA